jgi:hypothetical protein
MIWGFWGVEGCALALCMYTQTYNNMHCPAYRQLFGLVGAECWSQLP